MAEDYPLAIMGDQHGTLPLKVGPGDCLVLVLRSHVWSQQNVGDLTRVLDRMGLDGRYAILYLDATDEALVVRAAPTKETD